jgi:purine nucleosidase
MTEKIIIDTDPGQDDAVALLLALAARDLLDVRGILAVAGNVPVEQATRNVVRVCELAACSDVPIHAGAEGPLVFPLETAEFVCGPDGLAGSGLPAARGQAASRRGVTFLVETLLAEPAASVTLCLLGPLTNVALALRMEPAIRTRIKRVVLMGGAMNLGNMTPAAEFNFYVDPHAAHVVLHCGLPVVMFGLHATLQALASPEQVSAFGEMGTATGQAVHGMLTRPRAGGLGSNGHPMHDVCVIAWMLWPELFAGRDCAVDVEMSGGTLRGRSTIDWNGRLRKPTNAFVVDSVQATTLFERVIERLSRLP